jgi:hypothetical protein
MKKLAFFRIFLFLSAVLLSLVSTGNVSTGDASTANATPTPPTSGEDPAAITLLHKMYDRYHAKWHHNLTFNQTTEQYRHDSLIKSTTWYERILYPGNLRIDFDSIQSGNGFMLSGDSVYVYTHHAITRRIKGDNDGLVFILGGLYFMPFDAVLAKFKELHYDLGKSHNDTWKGRPVLVIGANSADEKVNQLWIDADKLVPVRFFKFDNNSKEEGIFEDHVAVTGGGWSETKCTFYRNDHLLQVEKYHDVTGDAPMDPAIFDPAQIAP